MNKKEFGDLGEKQAEEFLKKNGYKIVERNFRSSFGEIDIIGIDDNTLVFVEVKARSSRDFGLPEEAVGYRKLENIKKAAAYYRNFHKNLPEGERVDVLAIESENGKLNRIEIIKNVTG